MLFYLLLKNKEDYVIVEKFQDELSFFEELILGRQINRFHLKKLIIVYNEILNRYVSATLKIFLTSDLLNLESFTQFQNTYKPVKSIDDKQKILFFYQSAKGDDTRSLMAKCLHEISFFLRQQEAEGDMLSSSVKWAFIRTQLEDLSSLSAAFPLFKYTTVQLNKTSILVDLIVGYNNHLLALINLLYCRQMVFREMSLNQFQDTSEIFFELLVFDSLIFRYITDFTRFVENLNSLLKTN